MLTTTGTDYKGTVAIVAALIKRAWSFGVYYVGYRLLSVHDGCGSLAVSGVPLVMKLVA